MLRRQFEIINYIISFDSFDFSIKSFDGILIYFSFHLTVIDYAMHYGLPDVVCLLENKLTERKKNDDDDKS